MGMRMNGWYDLFSLDAINEGEDEEGLAESLRYRMLASFGQQSGSEKIL